MVELGLQVGHMAGLSDRARPHSNGPTLLWGVIQIASQKPGAKARPLFACVHRCSVIWLHNPMDCSLPGSSVRGVFHTRILEQVAISSSRGSSQCRYQTLVSCLLHWQVDCLPLSHLGSPDLFRQGQIIYQASYEKNCNFFPFKNSFNFWLYHMAGISLVPQPEIKPTPSAVKAQSPNHWTTRGFTQFFFHCICFLPFDDFPDCILLKVFTTN